MKYDDTFLARWHNGELTPEELEAFEKSDDFKLYNQIMDVSKTFNNPEFDKAKIRSNVKQKRGEQKVKKLNRYAVYGIAASLIVLFGLFYFMRGSALVFTTDIGEQQVVVLPDGSEAILNSNSTLSYNKDSWTDQRQLDLEGEAYFKVKKGSTFTVNSENGTVEVLGTQFNVISQPDYSEVLCFTGKVKVTTTSGDEAILTKGMGHRSQNNYVEALNFDPNDKTWIDGRTRFVNTPLPQVIRALENQFDIDILNSDILSEERFTGSFSNDSLEQSLKVIFHAMEVDYSHVGKEVKLTRK